MYSENRSSKSHEEPTGRIKLSLSATVEGDSERSLLSVTKQYKRLHEVSELNRSLILKWNNIRNSGSVCVCTHQQAM